MTKRNESGRSMVEMLGVLAIVGVLSIGGLAGYTTAMNKYRATEIMNTISLTLVEAETRGEIVDYETAYHNIPSAIRTIISNVYVDPGARRVALILAQGQGSGSGAGGTIACTANSEPCQTVANSLQSSQAFEGYAVGTMAHGNQLQAGGNFEANLVAVQQGSGSGSGH